MALIDSVSRSPSESKSQVHLSPAALAADANKAGFKLLSSRLLRLSSGKGFAVQAFQFESDFTVQSL
jgi:predicted methyltransferase